MPEGTLSEEDQIRRINQISVAGLVQNAPKASTKFPKPPSLPTSRSESRSRPQSNVGLVNFFKNPQVKAIIDSSSDT
eukprot:UN06221